jgi:MFS family permease
MPRHSLRDFIHVALRQPGVLAAATALAIAGAVGGVTQLLVPLELHRAGFSASGTGLAFSASAGLYIVVSAIVVRLGDRAMTVRCVAYSGLVLALSLLPAALGVGAVGLVGVLLLSTGPRSVITAVSYPLAAETAATAGLGEGVVIGLLNGTWAIGLVLAPVIAGALDQAAGPATAYLSAIVPGTLGALWLLVRRVPATRAAGTESAGPPTQEHEPPTAEHELAPSPV